MYVLTDEYKRSSLKVGMREDRRSLNLSFDNERWCCVYLISDRTCGSVHTDVIWGDECRFLNRFGFLI